MKKNSASVMKAKIPKAPGPIALCNVGKVIPTTKLAPQLDILPSAIALGRGPTSNNSDPTKYGIGPSPSP